MEAKMDHEAYAGSYYAAMEASTQELEGMFEEAGRLRDRMTQINLALNALKPLFDSGEEGQRAPETMPADALSQKWNAETNQMKPKIDSTLGLIFA
jgi:hypothetical protein